MEKTLIFYAIISKAYKHQNSVLKLFNYFKNKIFPNGILFLQETHSTVENEFKWKFELYWNEVNLHFSHDKQICVEY